MTMICEKVREWRTNKGLTLEAAGAVLKISTSYLCEIETGKKEFTTSVIKKYLEADPDYFTPNDFYSHSKQTPH